MSVADVAGFLLRDGSTLLVSASRGSVVISYRTGAMVRRIELSADDARRLAQALRAAHVLAKEGR